MAGDVASSSITLVVRKRFLKFRVSGGGISKLYSRSNCVGKSIGSEEMTDSER